MSAKLSSCCWPYTAVALASAWTFLWSGCSSTPEDPNDLEKLGTVQVKVKDLSVRAWIADDDDERMKGLMFRTADELAPRPDGTEPGMIFVFKNDVTGGFWMRNTIVDLDIAFIRVDGSIVQTFTMAALDERSYRPHSPYRYALELRAGVLAQHDISGSDHVEIPDSLLKSAK